MEWLPFPPIDDWIHRDLYLPRRFWLPFYLTCTCDIRPTSRQGWPHTKILRLWWYVKNVCPYFVHLHTFYLFRWRLRSQISVCSPLSISLGTPLLIPNLCSHTWVQIELYLFLPRYTFTNIYTHIYTQSYLYIKRDSRLSRIFVTIGL